MSTAVKIRTCAECRFDGGQHFTEDTITHEIVATRPHHEEAAAAQAVIEQHQRALELTAAANRAAFREAQRIIRSFAETHAEFSGNDTRAAFDDAGIPSGVRGAAFAAVAREGRCIEHSGRYTASTDGPTHGHRIGVYVSLIRRAGCEQ